MKIQYLKSILGTINELEMRIKLISNKDIINFKDIKTLEKEKTRIEKDLKYIEKFGDRNNLNNMLST